VRVSGNIVNIYLEQRDEASTKSIIRWSL